MILVFTGNGKGKTTVALGQALRSVGNGKKIKMIQFVKGPWKSGEEKSAKKLAPDFELVKGGIGFVGILGDKHPRSAHEEAARKTWELCKEAVDSKKYNLVIMDEINVALDLRLIDAGEVKFFLKSAPKDIDLILTGRGAPEWLIDMADLVTEMKDVKHPYNDGAGAKKGIEF
ncbi:MAG TPA: cob(I)yrinic acid a,c-diamide adenosyltransferase [Candidatus Paceibacterota bacterium]